MENRNTEATEWHVEFISLVHIVRCQKKNTSVFLYLLSWCLHKSLWKAFINLLSHTNYASLSKKNSNGWWLKIETFGSKTKRAVGTVKINSDTTRKRRPHPKKHSEQLIEVRQWTRCNVKYKPVKYYFFNYADKHCPTKMQIVHNVQSLIENYIYGANSLRGCHMYLAPEAF